MTTGRDESSRWRIVDATMEDADEVDRFADRVWASYRDEQGQRNDVDWRSRPLALLARDEDGALVGLARGRISAGVGHLSELLVAGPIRGHGLGGELLATLEHRCWAAGCHKITLHTELHGPARPFYERHGWQHEATHIRDKAGLDYARMVKFRDDA